MTRGNRSGGDLVSVVTKGNRSVTTVPKGFGSDKGGTDDIVSLPKGFGSDNGVRTVTTEGI